MTTMMFWARGLITWGLVGLAGSLGPALLLNALPALDTGFFGTVARHLKPGGVVVLQENNAGSTPDSFTAMIADAGLRLVFVQDASDTRTVQPHMYYLGIMRPDDPVPAWAQG